MGGSARGRAAAALGLGAVLLALAWRASPLPFPPMYEGLTAPAQPYRYLHPPPGLGSEPPAGAHQGKAPTQGQSPPLDPQTGEQPPQAQLLAGQDSFVLPPGTLVVEAAISAADPPSLSPLGGQVLGNVYDIAVTAAGTPLAVRPGRKVTVVLRGPAGIANPTIERYAAGSWSRAGTEALGAIGGDEYSADVTALGDFALVGAPAAASGGGGDPFIVVLAVAAVVLTAGTLLALRRSRHRSPPQRTPLPGRRRPPPPARRR